VTVRQFRRESGSGPGGNVPGGFADILANSETIKANIRAFVYQRAKEAGMTPADYLRDFFLPYLTEGGASPGELLWFISAFRPPAADIKIGPAPGGVPPK
jgi:hypothetical protein